MDVVLAKVPAELESVGDREISEVLVSEGHHFAFRDVSGQLILPGIAEGTELHAFDFSADGRCEVIHFNTFREEFRV